MRQKPRSETARSAAPLGPGAGQECAGERPQWPGCGAAPTVRRSPASLASGSPAPLAHIGTLSRTAAPPPLPLARRHHLPKHNNSWRTSAGTGYSLEEQQTSLIHWKHCFGLMIMVQTSTRTGYTKYKFGLFLKDCFVPVTTVPSLL